MTTQSTQNTKTRPMIQTLIHGHLMCQRSDQTLLTQQSMLNLFLIRQTWRLLNSTVQTPLSQATLVHSDSFLQFSLYLHLLAQPHCHNLHRTLDIPVLFFYRHLLVFVHYNTTTNLISLNMTILTHLLLSWLTTNRLEQLEIHLDILWQAQWIQIYLSQRCGGSRIEAVQVGARVFYTIDKLISSLLDRHPALGALHNLILLGNFALTPCCSREGGCREYSPA